MVRAAALVVLLLSALLAVPAQAHHVPGCTPEQCRVIVPPPVVPYVRGSVDFESFWATVAIQDSLAKTSLRLGLSNTGSTATEATLSLPLPDGASLVAFNLSWEGRLLEGRVTERGQAIQEYNNATAQGLDAALLQQADRHLVTLRVNVAPGEQRILQASYVEPVPLAAGHRVYRLPLSNLDPAPDLLRVNVTVQSSLGTDGLRTSGLQIPMSNGQGSVLLSNPSDVDDLLLLWEEEGASRSILVAADDPEDGMTEYWAQMCAEGTPLSRDVVFVLDQSGSMAGLKIEEGRQTLEAALESVHSTDRYSIVLFSNDATPFTSSLVPGDSSHVDADQRRVSSVGTLGGTNIDGALQEAFRQLNAADSARLPMVVFITDGLPTVGVTDHAQIIRRAQESNDREAPIHVVPIGLDADQTFLADLALRTGGAFVDVGQPDEATSDRLARLLQVLAGPVVMEPELQITGGTIGQVLPRVLPPLYHESCLDVRFRADASGPLTLKLTGTGASGAYVHQATFDLGAIPVEPAVSALYGRALVADLLATERLEPSSALRAALIENATHYSQLSPYTAWVLADVSPTPPPATGEASGAPGSPNVGATTGTVTGAASPTGGQGVGVGSPDQAGGDGGDTDGGDASDEASTPGFGLLAAVAALAAVALALRRRS